jgi:acetoin utilization deacetylase AcuC-like enzyme
MQHVYVSLSKSTDKLPAAGRIKGARSEQLPLQYACKDRILPVNTAKKIMNIYYSDTFVLPLPPDHRFPIQKYALTRQRVQESGLFPPERIRVPDPATDDQLALAHDRAYIEKVKTGGLSAKEIRRMGFPWSPELVERSRRSVGGTINACRSALADRCGLAVNLAGGTHHAGRDHGEGFCVFNDVAVAARVMQQEGRTRRVAILDCDVHQGNGTAAILAGDPAIFTFSIHGEKNFPFRKSPSDLDIGLDNDTGDAEYLAMLEEGVWRSLALANPDLVIYLAGADPYAGDRLGRLALTKAGLLARDRLVLAMCRERDLPVAIVMAGGYAPDVHEIAAIHFQTVRLAGELAGVIASESQGSND